ncbi:Uu.00g027670.m01.CDS01 [Anthostomella pinea]|uniref:Folylpolyglutamate synthase n=1 Tax=Anthostomella pinea TaxID=933095 RepID=A0AAI8V7M6_9PEZI|nr:Uu.00g027670.m01.CDS01 [Anthostomella pinea]
MARTYDSALSHLSLLQSNRAITSLFAPPPATPSTPSSPSAKPAPQDLNALAIPEMLSWLQRAGLSPDSLAQLRCIHVAGTKGKGSVCAYLTSLLTQPAVQPVAGRVGTYTSPHLVSVRERIMLDGRPISRELFTRYFFEVWDAFTESARAEAARLGKSGGEISEDDLRGPGTKPFYFRFLTIMAFRVFLAEGVRSAVVECGIGGEYDSTNVLPASAVTASVVTQLGIDHVGMLGSTLPEITWHKAGVCKEGRKCFTRRLENEEGAQTMKVLRQRAAEKGAVLVEVDDAEVEAWGGVQGDESGSLEGEFQRYNQALAVGAAREHLRVLEGGPDSQAEGKCSEEIPEGFVKGLQQARLRGRCETTRDGNITWLIDGAHTAESLEEVAKWFAGKWKGLPNARRVLMFNQQERDAAKLLDGLLEGIKKQQGPPNETLFNSAFFTRNELQGRADGEPVRDLDVQQAAAEIMQSFCPETTTKVVDNVADAVAEVRAAVRRDRSQVAVLVTGSLHLVGALLRTLEPDAQL